MCGFWLENSGFADLFLAPAGWLCTSLRSNHSYLILRSGRRPRLEGWMHGKDSRPSFETPCYARLLRMRALVLHMQRVGPPFPASRRELHYRTSIFTSFDGG